MDESKPTTRSERKAIAQAEYDRSNLLMPKLYEIAYRARVYEDEVAEDLLRLIGECLSLTGGFIAMSKLQSALHEHELKNEYSNYDVSGNMGGLWEHIPDWHYA